MPKLAPQSSKHCRALANMDDGSQDVPESVDIGRLSEELVTSIQDGHMQMRIDMENLLSTWQLRIEGNLQKQLVAKSPGLPLSFVRSIDKDKTQISATGENGIAIADQARDKLPAAAQPGENGIATADQVVLQAKTESAFTSPARSNLSDPCLETLATEKTSSVDLASQADEAEQADTAAKCRVSVASVADEAKLADTLTRSRVSLVAEERHEVEVTSIFELAEEIKQAKLQRGAASWCERLQALSRTEILDAIDVPMAVLILLNAMFIGVSMDGDSQQGAFFIIDGIFTCLFLLEIVGKNVLLGVCGYFRITSNVFDAFLVIIDCVNFVILLSFQDDAFTTIPNASLFRMLRLIKLTRILRLLEAEIFTDLLHMLRGFSEGVTVLGWAMVVLCMVLYMVSLFLREMLGRNPELESSSYFENVPRAIYTTFRCSFGDCNSYAGAPLFELVTREYGEVWAFLYCLFFLGVTMMLFNVISATFVERTIAASNLLYAKKIRKRLESRDLWSTLSTEFITMILKHSPSCADELPDRNDAVEKMGWKSYAQTLLSLNIETSALVSLVQDPAAKSILLELDIDPEDNGRLADIFDPDNNGTIEVGHLVEGLQRLRGKPRRSDIVVLDCMLRDIQLQISDMETRLLQKFD